MCSKSHNAAIDFNISRRGFRYIRSKPNRVTKKNEELITLAWTRLEQGLVTPLEALHRAKYRLGGGKILILKYGISLLSCIDASKCMPGFLHLHFLLCSRGEARTRSERRLLHWTFAGKLESVARRTSRTQ